MAGFEIDARELSLTCKSPCPPHELKDRGFESMGPTPYHARFINVELGFRKNWNKARALPNYVVIFYGFEKNTLTSLF